MVRFSWYVLFLFSISTNIPASALILHTSDGGQTWIREESNTVFNLNDVAVSIVSNIAVAVGDNGTILRRDESGIWTDVSPEGLSSDLYSVAVSLSGMMACGEGGTLLSSFNGGTEWRELTEFGYEEIDLLSVNFDPTNTNSFLITGEDGFIYSSKERGIVPTEVSSDFVVSCVTLCSGFPELVLGRDGTGFSLRSNTEFEVSDSAVRGATEIVSGGGSYIAVGEGGDIFRYSTDIGWEPTASITEEDLNSVSYLIWGVSACAVGDKGTVLVSDDNGLSWQKESLGVSRDLTSVAGNGAGFAFIVGSNALSGVVNLLPFREVSH